MNSNFIKKDDITLPEGENILTKSEYSKRLKPAIEEYKNRVDFSIENGEEIILYKKQFLEYINLNHKKLPEKGRKKLEKKLDDILPKMFNLLGIEEFQNINFEKMMGIIDVFGYQDILKTKFGFLRFLKKHGGFSVNLDLGDYCNHNCSHCSISVSNKEAKCDINGFLKQFDNIPEKDFKRLVKEISFYNFGELLDYEDFNNKYKNFIDKLKTFLSIVEDGEDKIIDMIYKKGNILDKIVLKSGFEIYFRINLLKPIGRGKNKTNEKINNDGVTLTSCAPIIDPYTFTIDKVGDLKTCFQKDVSSSTKYTFSNVSDQNFLKEFIEIKRKFFTNIKLEDLIGKSDKHFCMASNLLKDENK